MTLFANDLASAARARLVYNLPSLGPLNTLVGADLDENDDPTGPWSDGWVFTSPYDDNAPLRVVEGSGLCAISVLERDEWGAPNAHNTARFPNLRVNIYADDTRDAEGNPTMKDAFLKARNVANLVKACFHDAANQVHDWSYGIYRLRIISSLLASTNYDEVPSGDGLIRCAMVINVAVPDDLLPVPSNLPLPPAEAPYRSHRIATPATTWTFVHNLNTKPAVLLFLDSDPTEPHYTTVTYPDYNTVIVEWPTAESGWIFY